MGLSQQSQDGRKMEGWLHLIRFNRFGLQSSRKRYFVLEHNALNCYKSVPASSREEPLRSALLDSGIRVTDNGRENIHKNVLFIFTLYNASNHNDQLKLGARSSEEAARWIRALMEAAMKLQECSKINGENVLASSKRWQSFRVFFPNSRPKNFQLLPYIYIYRDVLLARFGSIYILTE